MQHILKWFWFAKVISFVNYQIAIDLDRQVNSSGSRFLAGKRWSRGISWSRTSFQLCNQATDLLLWTRHFANHRPKQSTAAKKQEVKEEGDFPCNWNLKSKLFPISLMAPPFGRYGCLCVQSNAPSVASIHGLQQLSNLNRNFLLFSKYHPDVFAISLSQCKVQ